MESKGNTVINTENVKGRNIFEEEVILSDKEKMRKKLLTNKDEMMEEIKEMTPIDIFVLFDEDNSG